MSASEDHRRSSDEHRTHRARPAFDPDGSVQSRRSVLRRRRCRQDDDRRGDGAAGRRVRPNRRRPDDRPGQAACAGPWHQGPRQHAAAGATRARGDRRIARDDARHASHVRRDGHPVLRRRPRGSDPGEPVLPNRRHVARGHAGVHGHGEARPAARRGQVGSRRRRHSPVAQRARLPRCAKTPRQLHGQSAVASAAGARARHRQAGDRRGRPGHEGAVDRPGFPNAFRRSRFRAGPGFDVQRFPREGRSHLRIVEATGHPVRRRSRRPSRTRCARRPSSSTACRARRCRSPD